MRAALSVALVHLALLDAHPLARMLALVAVLFFWMKVAVAAGASVPLGFYLAWPGMRVAAFRRRRDRAYPDAWIHLGWGVFWFGLGALLVGAGSLIPLMVGLSLMLHFGLFRISTALWRFCGYDCRRLFRAPLLSRSLGEFWSRRWNLAFTELVQETVYRPVAARWGPAAATMAGFLFSGLLHEVAISLPVRAGFGGPLLYFFLHGLLVLFERRFRVGGRLWTFAWLIVPAPLIFHPPFVAGILT